jgi:CheY-like chemotaxis protein
VLKFKQAAKLLELSHQFIFAENGEAFSVLERDLESLPHIILLDLNMPCFDGFEFLNLLRSTNALSYIPTIIMTTSENEKDLKKCC